MGQSKFSYELTFWLILIKNSGKQKNKNTLRVEINQLCDCKSDTGILFLNTELNKPQFLRDEMIFIHCSLQIKQNIYSKRHFSCSCSDTIYSKSIKKNRKKSHF